MRTPNTFECFYDLWTPWVDPLANPLYIDLHRSLKDWRSLYDFCFAFVWRIETSFVNNCWNLQLISVYNRLLLYILHPTQYTFCCYSPSLTWWYPLLCSRPQTINRWEVLPATFISFMILGYNYKLTFTSQYSLIDSTVAFAESLTEHLIKHELRQIYWSLS